MTERLYHADSYIQEFDARVQEAIPEVRAVVLNRTAFYPGGGGQPCDLGTLSGVAVSSVKLNAGKIMHVLDGELPPEGASVLGALDWERRHRLMRTHTAMHILCGVVFRDYGAQVTGGDMEPLKGRMDFEFERLERELVGKIELAVNAEVVGARDVRVQMLPREEAFRRPDLIRTKINLLPADIQEVRTVEIVGLDIQADGGTHVRNTHEVGRVRVTDYKSKGAINKRIYVEILD